MLRAQGDVLLPHWRLTVLALVLLPRLSFAQTPGNPPPDGSQVQRPVPSRVEGPGPYVVDIRGTMIGVPQTSNFYPNIPGQTVVPARGFGAEAGVHVYPIAIGTRRIGLGVDIFVARGTAATPPITSSVTSEDGTATTVVETFPDVAVDVRILSPEVSINFGTSRGWSQLSAGVGPARVETTAGPARLVTTKTVVNAGAGARWFVTDHVGVGFDLRAHWMGSRALFAASAGFSLK